MFEVALTRDDIDKTQAQLNEDLFQGGANVNPPPGSRWTPLDVLTKRPEIWAFLELHGARTVRETSTHIGKWWHLIAELALHDEDVEKTLVLRCGCLPDHEMEFNMVIASTENYLRCNMLINLSTTRGRVAAASHGHIEVFKILHPDDRFRHLNRVVRVKDRVILKVEETGELLSRKKGPKGSWVVTYDGDNYHWTVTTAL